MGINKLDHHWEQNNPEDFVRHVYFKGNPVIAAVLAFYLQACSVFVDPLPAYNDPDAIINNTPKDSGDDTADTDNNNDAADADLDTAIDTQDEDDVPADDVPADDVPADDDEDGVPDEEDNCPAFYNPRQAILNELNGQAIDALALCQSPTYGCDDRECPAPLISGGLIKKIFIEEDPQYPSVIYFRIAMQGEGLDLCHNVRIITLDPDLEVASSTSYTGQRIASTDSLGYCFAVPVDDNVGGYSLQIISGDEGRTVLGSATVVIR